MVRIDRLEHLRQTIESNMGVTIVAEFPQQLYLVGQCAVAMVRPVETCLGVKGNRSAGAAGSAAAKKEPCPRAAAARASEIKGVFMGSPRG